MTPVQHISISINRPPAEVYAWAGNPLNLPQWAAGLARSQVSPDGDSWQVQAPFGRVRLRFAPANDFGVMDHDVELETGEVVHNPMRVVPNGTGSEFIFTLIRQPGMTDAQFEADAQAVAADLQTLKKLLEAQG